MLADLPNNFHAPYPYAVHATVQTPQDRGALLDEPSASGSSSIHFFNSGRLHASDFSIATLRQAIFETLSDYFTFSAQIETVAFIAENTWMISGLINCSNFLRSSDPQIDDISLEYHADLGTLYLNVAVKSYHYAKISHLRDKFFDFILPQKRLFKAINIDFRPNEV